MESIQSTIRDFGKALKSFKDTQEKRLDHLETQSKMAGLSSEPPSLGETQEGPVERKHFQRFLRGEEALATKGLSVGAEPGSFAVPGYLQNRIQLDLEGAGSFRGLASVLKISTSHVDLLLDSSLPEAKWVRETEERPETKNPHFRKCRIPVHELYAKPCITQKLLEDAEMDVEDWLVHKVAQKMRALENKAFLQGTGEGEPRGILSYGHAAEAHGAGYECFETLNTGEDGGFVDDNSAVLLDLMHRLPANYLSGAKWIMSSSALARIRMLRAPSGQPYYEHHLEAPFRTQILGYPVVIMEEMPPLVPGETSRSVLFGNFQEAYQIVDRKDMNILRDPYSQKPHVEFYINKRVGGDVVDFNAIKVLNFGS